MYPVHYQLQIPIRKQKIYIGLDKNENKHKNLSPDGCLMKLSVHSHTTNPFIENPGERVVQKQLLELRSAVMKGRQKQNLEIAWYSKNV